MDDLGKELERSKDKEETYGSALASAMANEHRLASGK